MENDMILNLISGVLLLIGLIGTFLPVLPGASLAFIGLLVFKFSEDCTYSWFLVIGAGVLVLIGLLLEYILPIYMTKKLGGSKYGVWGAIIGLIVGLFFPPIGFLIGPFVGALIAELILNSNLYFPHPFIKDYSHVKKNIVIYVRNCIVIRRCF